MSLRSAVKSLLPGFVLKLFRKPSPYGFFGDYASWEDARKDSKGYDSPVIFEKMRKSALAVRSGAAAFERDTVAFKSAEQNHFVLSALLERARKDRRLCVVDFGGSFGNVYLQHRPALEKVKDLKWIVVEQRHVAEFGAKEFRDGRLSFSSDMDAALAAAEPNVVLFASSLQYAEKPYDILSKATESGAGTIIIDRTPLFEGNERERTVVQKVRPEIYDASYPAWTLNEGRVKDFMTGRSYRPAGEASQGFMALDGTDRIALRGLVFERNA